MPLHAAADTICGYIYSASERYTYVTKAHEQKSAFNLRTKQKQSASQENNNNSKINPQLQLSLIMDLDQCVLLQRGNTMGNRRGHTIKTASHAQSLQANKCCQKKPWAAIATMPQPSFRLASFLGQFRMTRTKISQLEH